MSNDKNTQLTENEKSLFKHLVFIYSVLVTHAKWTRDYFFDNDRTRFANDTQYNLFRNKHLVNLKMYDTLAASYTKRQQAFRAQPKSNWSELKDKTYTGLKSAWSYLSNKFGINGANNGVNGIGVIPLLIPIVLSVGGWIIGKYFSSSDTDKNTAANLAKDLAATNPQAAIQLAKIAAEQEIETDNNANKSTLSSQVGQGVKWLTIIGGGGLVIKYVILPAIFTNTKKTKKTK